MEENYERSNVRVRPGIRQGSGRRTRRPSRGGGRPNYRLVLCIALLVCLALCILFFALFMGQRGKVREMNDKLTQLGNEKTALSEQITSLQKENQTLTDGLLSSAPAPKTAETEALADLIPQLTDAVYVVHKNGEAYQYVKIPEGYLTDKLMAFRDANGYESVAESGAWSYWVLYADRVVGLADDGKTGFVSTERTAEGASCALPAGFGDFVKAFFA